MQPHLILDEQSVAESRGVTFHLNPATKHPENPILIPREPHEWDSLQVVWPGTVLYSPRDRMFRCWYGGFDAIQTRDRCWRYGYAESDDGIHWTRPNLGQDTFLGRPTNMLKPNWMAERPKEASASVFGTHTLSLVFENPIPDAPESQRFGSYWIEQRIDVAANKCWGFKTLAWSPDGRTWTNAGPAYELATYTRPGFQDISQLLYDPDESDPDFRVKGYTQILRPRPWQPRQSAVNLPDKAGVEMVEFSALTEVRQIGLVHGKDFSRVRDAADPIVLAPEEGIDEELHFAAVRKIGGSYVMLFESDRFSTNPLNGDLRLAVSNDGRKFRRVHARTPLVATGPKGTWDENILVTTTSAMQEVGDEIRIYYFGCPNLFRAWPAQYVFKDYPAGHAPDAMRRGSMFCPSYMGLATLPRDRFAYAGGAGTLTTHPINLSGGDLWINADGDDITVAGGTLTDERRQGVYRKVRWKDSAKPPRGPTSIRITISENTKLFSLACG